MTAIGLLNLLWRQGGTVSVDDGDLVIRDLTDEILAPLLADLREKKQAIVALLVEGRQDILHLWQRRISRANDHRELGEISADAQIAFVNNEITGTECERIAVMLIQESHVLPEQADAVSIPGESLYCDDTTCYACGQEAWYLDASGVRKCAVCHPGRPQRTPQKKGASRGLN